MPDLDWGDVLDDAARMEAAQAEAEAAQADEEEWEPATCEDWPCCGHEAGDCRGLLYGSDDDIKARVQARWDDPDIDPMDPMYDEEGW